MLQKSHCIYCITNGCKIRCKHYHCTHPNCTYIFYLNMHEEPHFHCQVKSECNRLDFHIHCNQCDWVGDIEYMHQHCYKCGDVYMWGDVHNHETSALTLTSTKLK